MVGICIKSCLPALSQLLTDLIRLCGFANPMIRNPSTDSAAPTIDNTQAMILFLAHCTTPFTQKGSFVSLSLKLPKVNNTGMKSIVCRERKMGPFSLV